MVESGIMNWMGWSLSGETSFSRGKGGSCALFFCNRVVDSQGQSSAVAMTPQECDSANIAQLKAA